MESHQQSRQQSPHERRQESTGLSRDSSHSRDSSRRATRDATPGHDALGEPVRQKQVGDGVDGDSGGVSAAEPELAADSPPVDLRSELEPMRPRLLGILRRFRVPPEDAEDLLQDVLVDFVQKRRFIEDPEGWLVIVTRRRCLDYSRQRRRRFVEGFDAALLELVAGGVSAPQEHETLIRQLEEIIDTLQPKCRDLLRMRYIEGRTESEIAELKGYKTSSISKLCGRCVTALAKRLAEPPELRAIGNGKGPRN